MITSRKTSAMALALVFAFCSAVAEENHRQHVDHAKQSSAPPVFVASSVKSFAALMDDAMAVMHAGMQQAPMNGQSEHDFLTMMIPHHQGAVDMAKAVLLHSQDPEIRNLALGIIAEQQNEINLMQARLMRHSQAIPTKDEK